MISASSYQCMLILLERGNMFWIEQKFLWKKKLWNSWQFLLILQEIKGFFFFFFNIETSVGFTER